MSLPYLKGKLDCIQGYSYNNANPASEMLPRAAEKEME